MNSDASRASAGDLVRFVDESSHVQSDPAKRPLRFWRVLIIDDDVDVHQATLFALDPVELFGRSLQFLHAHSAEEARQLLINETDLALILLDVVMETPDAGLDLVDFIRNTARLNNTRIVLRTGQPGYAPEHDTILRYDINDYKTKSELTHHKLLTTVTTALRSYEQLCTIEASRKGLELIVNASGSMIESRGVQTFAAGVIRSWRPCWAPNPRDWSVPRASRAATVTRYWRLPGNLPAMSTSRCLTSPMRMSAICCWRC